MSAPSFHVRRLSIAEILDEGFRLFRHGFLRFLIFQLIVYVPTTALLAYGILGAGDIITEMVEESSIPELGPLAVKLALFILALVALQIVAGAIVTIATSRAVADSYLGRSWTTRTILAESFRLAPIAIVLGAILTLILAFGAGAPLGIAVGLAVLATASSSGGALFAALAVLFGLALSLIALVAGFLVILRYGLALVAMAVERIGVKDALARSIELMRGRYVRGLALFLILLAVNLLITSVISAFLPTPSFEGVDPDELGRLLPQFIRGQVLSTISSQVAGIFVQIYTSICWTLFYFTARCEAEAFDLSHLAERTAEG